MKTMQQMQSEMLSKAKFDGGYPRLVVLPFGILALARDEKEWNTLQRQSDSQHKWFAIGLIAIAVGALCAMAYSIF